VQIAENRGGLFWKKRKVGRSGQEDQTAIQVYVTLCLGKKESERYSYKEKLWVWLRILQHHFTIY
jgi:hypothetical protein